MKSTLFTRFVRFLCIALLAMTVAANTATAQTQVASADAQAGKAEEVFVSWDTLTVGCAAGGLSAVAAGLMPLVTSYAGGPTNITGDLLFGWAGLGCAVGVWAGIFAIATAWILDSM